jgi:hypothetical protein
MRFAYLPSNALVIDARNTVTRDEGYQCRDCGGACHLVLPSVAGRREHYFRHTGTPCRRQFISEEEEDVGADVDFQRGREQSRWHRAWSLAVDVRHREKKCQGRIRDACVAEQGIVVDFQHCRLGNGEFQRRREGLETFVVILDCTAHAATRSEEVGLLVEAPVNFQYNYGTGGDPVTVLVQAMDGCLYERRSGLLRLTRGERHFSAWRVAPWAGQLPAVFASDPPVSTVPRSEDEAVSGTVRLDLSHACRQWGRLLTAVPPNDEQVLLADRLRQRRAEEEESRRQLLREAKRQEELQGEQRRAEEREQQLIAARVPPAARRVPRGSSKRGYERDLRQLLQTLRPTPELDRAVALYLEGPRLRLDGLSTGRELRERGVQKDNEGWYVTATLDLWRVCGWSGGATKHRSIVGPHAWPRLPVGTEDRKEVALLIVQKVEREANNGL